jgi:hypothetical protein
MQICFQFVHEYIYKKITCFLSKKKALIRKSKFTLKVFFIYNFNHSNFKNIYYNYHKIK